MKKQKLTQRQKAPKRAAKGMARQAKLKTGLKTILAGLAIILTFTGVMFSNSVTAQAAVIKNKVFYIYSAKSLSVDFYANDDKNAGNTCSWTQYSPNGKYGTITKQNDGFGNWTLSTGAKYAGYRYKITMTNVNVSDWTPYIDAKIDDSSDYSVYAKNFEVIKYGTNGCNKKANEVRNLKQYETTDGSLFMYIGYGFCGDELKLNTGSYTYNVTYNTNGGSYVGNVTEKSATTATIIATGPSRNGYTFTGWKCDYNGKTYKGGESFKPTWTSSSRGTISVTMTAQWIPVKYNVSYEKNKPKNASHEVTGSMTTTSHTYDQGSNLRANAFALEGWTFEGWTTNADGSGTVYTNKQQIWNLSGTSEATVKLYAKWEPKVYTIGLSAIDGDTVGTSVIYEKYDTGFYSDISCKSKMTNITLPTKVNYDCIGFYDGDTKQINGSKISMNASTYIEDTTLYAKWDAAVYKITLDLNGSDDTAATSVFYEKFGKGFYSNKACTTKLGSIKNPSREHYTFGGYYTKKNNAEIADTNALGIKTITNQGNISVGNTQFTEDTILYALWIPNQYIITLDSEGAYAQGSDKITELYSLYFTVGKKKAFDTGERRTDTFSGYSGDWKYFIAPYKGDYTFSGGIDGDVTYTLEEGEIVKIYNRN